MSIILHIIYCIRYFPENIYIYIKKDTHHCKSVKPIHFSLISSKSKILLYYIIIDYGLFYNGTLNRLNYASFICD